MWTYRLQIKDSSLYLAPGDCDVTGCRNAGRYVLGNLYLCAPCLIDGCENGSIGKSAVVYRLPQFHSERIFAPPPCVEEYTS
jgi:hypothetical protein